MAGKKHFSMVTKLGTQSPEVLVEFLSRFAGYLETKGVVLPEGPNEEGDWVLDYPGIRNACIANDIPDQMNTVLFLVSKLGTQKGWEEIQEEAGYRGVALDFSRRSLTMCDLAMKAWLCSMPDHEDLLEESFARVRIHGKSSYTYYPPTGNYLSQYRKPTPAMLRSLEKTLAEHFVHEEILQAGSSGVKVLHYEYDQEVWFLVRYPGQPQRQETVSAVDGAEKDVFFTPGEYDAVVYNRVYGDLRVNTSRKPEHAAYRMAFGHALLGESNAFDPSKAIIRLDPLKSRCEPFFDVKHFPGLRGVRIHEVAFFSLDKPGLRQTWFSDSGNLFDTVGDGGRLVPVMTDTVLYAKFKYRIENTEKWHSMTVHEGKNLRYERDGDSAVVESWLRKHRFIEDVLGLDRHE